MWKPRALAVSLKAVFETGTYSIAQVHIELLSSRHSLEWFPQATRRMPRVHTKLLMTYFSQKDGCSKWRENMNDSVDSRNLAIQIIFLSQSTGGILGIVSVLSSYLICYYTECTSKLPDLTLTHLIMANSLTILSKRTLHTMALFYDEAVLQLLWMQTDFICLQTVQKHIHCHHLPLDCLPGNHH